MSHDTLEIPYRIRGFRRTLYVPLPDWPCCIFEQDEDLDVLLRIVEVGMTLDTDFPSVIAAADARVRRLVLAWELRYACPLRITRLSIVWPEFPATDGSVMISDTAMFGDQVDAHILFAPPPEQMPQAPLGAERWIRTFAEAGDFEDYAEEQLRRHYLIIEEMEDNYITRLDPADQEKCKEIGFIRDFVSHPECDRKQALVDFISAHLPGAVVYGRSKPTVRFDRLNIEHRNFVGRYVVDSDRIARKLIELAIEDLPTTPHLLSTNGTTQS